ncbi:alcohol dehydrogenase YqhD (iron-dependent ADH family) [Clostridium beijerinckii]|nr:alcohol dehydrogenase YqhD (iron-dependent ADH family) [Clostridium beijerinckii]
MENFNYSIPTKVYFGKGQIKNLAAIIKESGNKILIAYGGGSIKKIGLYDEMIKILNDNSISYVELSGIEPNPRIETVRKGIKICKENNVEVVSCCRRRKYNRLCESYCGRSKIRRRSMGFSN